MTNENFESDEDKYLWLEDVEGGQALDWVRAENAKTLDVLETEPHYQDLHDKIAAILTATDRIPYGSFDGEHVYNFWQDEKHIRGILRRTSLQSYRSANPDWEMVLDVDALADSENENWVYQDLQILNPDRDRAVVTLSRGGSDASVIREFDLIEKKFVVGGFSVNEAKTNIAWLDRNRVLIGTDFGPNSMTSSGYARIAKIWQRGTTIGEASALFEGGATDMGVWPFVSIRDGRRDAFVVQKQSFYESTYKKVMSDGALRDLPLPPTAQIETVFRGLLFVSLKEAWTNDGEIFPQGAIITFDLNHFDETGIAQLSLFRAPEKEETIESVAASRDSIFVLLLSDVTNRLVRYELNADIWQETLVALPAGGSLTLHSISPHHNLVMVSYESFLTPASLYFVDGAKDPEGPVKRLPERFDASLLSFEQRFVVSKDGTRVPYFIVAPKNMTSNGDTPTLQYGYGGFEVSLKPAYLGAMATQWVLQGGAYVIANIRGGGEYGPRWHRSAMKLSRQRAFDDFIAVSEDLITCGVTSPAHLGIMGGSNGGLLMGAMLTQRPELYGAVICAVPLLDMQRFHLLLAGASWVGEYGDPEDASEGAFLFSYSPFHNVQAGASYPEPFFMTSTKDDRVHPGHARKMAARMKDQGHFIYYYENIEGGHGAAANQLQQARNGALQIVYLLKKLGNDGCDGGEKNTENAIPG